jgi:hypothetical protein
VALLPAYLIDSVPNCYGEFAGLSAVSGSGRGSEDLVTVGRDTHLVVQDTSYTAARSYAAVLLA